MSAGINTIGWSKGKVKVNLIVLTEKFKEFSNINLYMIYIYIFIFIRIVLQSHMNEFYNLKTLIGNRYHVYFSHYLSRLKFTTWYWEPHFYYF